MGNLRFAETFSHYLRAQRDEIAGDPVLCHYGIFLAFVHVLSVPWWIQTGALDFLSHSSGSLCWPIFETCYAYKFPTATAVTAVFFLYGLLALVTMGLFALHRVRGAYALSILLLISKFVLFVLDFRMRGNHHYFAFIIFLLFLFIPQKRRTIGYMLVFFYVASSFLKFSDEWLSGAALSGRRPFWFTGHWLELACAYVVFLELIFVWALLRPRRSRLFWLVTLQLLAFHVLSYPIVSWFYPAVMGCLLALFYLRPEALSFPSNRISRAALLLFWLAQAVPLVYKGDTGLSVQGRFFAVTLIHVRPMCDGVMIAKKGSMRLELPMPVMQRRVRLWCDPLVFYGYAREQCRLGKESGAWDEIDFYLLAKRSRAEDWRPLLEARNFCSDQRKFPLFASNPWIYP